LSKAFYQAWTLYRLGERHMVRLAIVSKITMPKIILFRCGLMTLC